MKREILKNISTKQLKYLGHIKRHNAIIKTIIEERDEGKRPRRLVNNIKKCTGAPLYLLKQMKEQVKDHYSQSSPGTYRKI